MTTPQTTSIGEAAAKLVSISEQEGAERLKAARQSALRELGVTRLTVVSDFLIAVSAVGYTRITRDTGRSILTPFQTLDLEWASTLLCRAQ